MNIIIPLGGLGERFKKEGYTQPKPLINIFGKPMLFHVIDNINLKEEDKLILIYNKELNKYSFNQILKNKYKNIILIELDKQTEGAAETVHIVLSKLEEIDKNYINNKCVLFDCDTFYKINIIEYFRNSKQNMVICFKDKQDKSMFSYIKFDDNNIISEIKEKDKISEYANTGCYCFLKGSTLKQYCKNIIDNNIREKNEYYISCVIQEMLKNNQPFIAQPININDFVCVGTPLQLKIYCSDITNNTEKKRFCFDLDNTLVTQPEVINDYTTVKPIIKNIEELRFLKKMGHYIIIHTARRMKTHNSNVGKIVADIGKITIDTLEKFNIPYDEIYFGKPYADFYIDDLAVNAYDDLEKNMGFYITHISERDFNELITEKLDIIVKKSNYNKLAGEIYFYQNIPQKFKNYFPLFINHTSNSYSMEKINGITLSYLYVNESLNDQTLLKYLNILHDIHTFNNDNNNNNNININIYGNYCSKIKERYESFDYSKFNNSNAVYEKLMNFFKIYEENKQGRIGIIHGDPVFSNVLIDSNNNFKLIDMRGKIDSVLTIYGDIFYDLGKIYQSLIGYDEILLNKIITNDYKTKLINIFKKYIKETYGEEHIIKVEMIAYSLLFTLIPLHHNDKCNAYYSLIHNFN